MSVKVISVSKEWSEWNAFVQASPLATCYHLHQWRSIIASTFGHRCHYLAALDEHGVWQGVLPLVHMRSKMFGNFLVSMPFVNYGGVLARSEASRRALIAAANSLRRSCGATHVELRHIARQEPTLPVKQHKVSMLLRLECTQQAQWERFDSKLRNQIRKSEKCKLSYEYGGLNRLDEFYRVFAHNMRDLGTPVYPKHFFRSVIEAFPDSTLIALVQKDGVAIAAGLALWFRSRIEVPWASSLREFKSYCPNHMLYWGLLKYAIEQGCDVFDFGRSTPSEGTFNFKKQWGAQPLQLSWEYLMDATEIPELSPSNPKYRMAIRAWQRLPVPVANLLGPMIVKNIP